MPPKCPLKTQKPPIFLNSNRLNVKAFFFKANLINIWKKMNLNVFFFILFCCYISSRYGWMLQGGQQGVLNPAGAVRVGGVSPLLARAVTALFSWELPRKI